MSRRRLSILLFAITLFSRPTPQAQDILVSVQPSVSAGGKYDLAGVLGAEASPTMTGGTYSVQGGFFSPVLFLETLGAPLLKIQFAGDNVQVFWTAPKDAFQLQETTSLDGAWQILPAIQEDIGGQLKVTIPIGPQNIFLRLKSASP